MNFSKEPALGSAARGREAIYSGKWGDIHTKTSSGLRCKRRGQEWEERVAVPSALTLWRLHGSIQAKATFPGWVQSVLISMEAWSQEMTSNRGCYICQVISLVQNSNLLACSFIS